MTKSYCLTVEVKSDHIENGLGYMIAFRIPGDNLSPADMPEFEDWRDEVRKAVLHTGDQCLHTDAYTKKVAIAELMHDLTEINKKYGIQIGSVPEAPAIQINSTNPYDVTLEIDFPGENGGYKLTEKSIMDLQHAAVTEHGKTGLTEAARKSFPFKKSPPPVTPPTNKRISTGTGPLRPPFA